MARPTVRHPDASYTPSGARTQRWVLGQFVSPCLSSHFTARLALTAAVGNGHVTRSPATRNVQRVRWAKLAPSCLVWLAIGQPQSGRLDNHHAMCDDGGRWIHRVQRTREEAAMSAQLVTYAVDGRVGIISLNRPDKLNAISADLKRALIERFHEADRDPATGVVVLRAEGRSFCAGYDIGPNPARAARRGNALAWHESLTDDIALEMTPWDMKKPVIASVQGHCLGGGCELAMMCDLTIAADDAVFGEPEIRFSNVGPALVMPFVIGFKRARELLYLGDPIDAQTALRYGMVNRVVPRAELPAATLKLARRMALISPEALASTKLAINRGADAAGFRNAIRAGLDVLAPLYAARTEVGTKFDEIREKDGLGAALRWRAAQFAE